jgi:hypothetical protein
MSQIFHYNKIIINIKNIKNSFIFRNNNIIIRNYKFNNNNIFNNIYTNSFKNSIYDRLILKKNKVIIRN